MRGRAWVVAAAGRLVLVCRPAAAPEEGETPRLFQASLDEQREQRRRPLLCDEWSTLRAPSATSVRCWDGRDAAVAGTPAGFAVALREIQ